jgi:biotin carboxylase
VPIQKLLIANRGEIALRIHRACHEMGIRTVAVHSTADSDAMHVRLADETVCIGPPPATESYLNIPNIISAAEIVHADAVHPGYGFLSENAQFAEIVESHGITWVGPKPEHIRTMGDKIEAKRTAAKLGLPLVPGSDGPIEDIADAKRLAAEIGYPVLIKAASGGGGRGMKVVPDEDQFESLMSQAASEARAAFGDDTVYMEKYLADPRHIEFQVFGDGEGLTCRQEQIHFHGHAIECRINAEDPQTFMPSPGLVKNYVAPGGMHVRVDSGLYTGYRVPPYYDSMIGKLIVYGTTRERCIMRLRRALEEFVVEGMKTTIPLHQALVCDEEFLRGEYTIKWLEQWLEKQRVTAE